MTLLCYIDGCEYVQRELLARKQEEERWRDIPEWKKTLILEKEKKKQEEMVGMNW